MVREILVVKKEKLFPQGCFQGFLHEEVGKHILPLILGNFEYKERTDALEHDDSFKQIISYVWFINSRSKKVFFYRRTPTNRYKEVRLRNKWSGGVGGHIDKATEEFSENPVIDGMYREMHEEVRMLDYPDPKIIGFVHDEVGDVERVHFGVVAIAETTEDIGLGDGEIEESKFLTPQEVDMLISDGDNDIERWTKLSWPHVKQHLLAEKISTE